MRQTLNQSSCPLFPNIWPFVCLCLVLVLQYPLNSPMSRMESCLMSSTPRLHPAPVAPRWPDVSAANSCYSSPPMHSARYASPGDIYTPLGPRRNSEYEHSQHFPGFAYINGEATTGWAK